MTCANGDVYVGEWCRGKQHGRGALFSSKGRVLDGQWFRGKAQGTAVHVKGRVEGRDPTNMEDVLRVGGAGNRSGIGERGRLVVSTWKEMVGPDQEEDTLAGVEDRLRRKEAEERYHEWLVAVGNGDEDMIVKGVQDRVFLGDVGAAGHRAARAGVELRVLFETGERLKREREIARAKVEEGTAREGTRGGRVGGEFARLRACLEHKSSPWKSAEEIVTPVEVLALAFFHLLLKNAARGGGGGHGGGGNWEGEGVPREMAQAVLKLLLEHGMDPTTALVKAVSTSSLAVTRFLIEQGDLRCAKRALFSP